MEKLDRSVDAFLRGEPNLPLPIKRSIMKDVASGLVYLHGRNPAVIHRDLTANNVLLTSERRAKISDVGNSRIFDLLGQTTGTFTSVPGTLAYMPPEAQSCEPHYGCPLDIFSFGHLALYIATQVKLIDTQQFHAHGIIRDFPLGFPWEIPYNTTIPNACLWAIPDA